MNPMVVTIAPEIDRTRILMMSEGRDVLKAVLGPAIRAHSKAASTLLEGLALWHQTSLSVVLCADEQDRSNGLYLCDALDFGRKTLHYEVGVAVADRPGRRRDRRVLGGLGHFRDLRQLAFWEAQR